MWEKEHRKPVTREWLYQKYVVDGMNCTQIAAIVHRNAKRVWEWLRELGIPTRPRGSTQAVWFKNGHTASRGRKLSDEAKQKIRDARRRDGRVPYLLKDGTHAMKGRKGPSHPKWKHGRSPERSTFYQSKEWKKAARLVKLRDGGVCQKCGHIHVKGKQDTDIHHIESFGVVEKRCVLSNLVTLCEKCHYLVHGPNNTNKEFLA